MLLKQFHPSCKAGGHQAERFKVRRIALKHSPALIGEQERVITSEVDRGRHVGADKRLDLLRLLRIILIAPTEQRLFQEPPALRAVMGIVAMPVILNAAVRGVALIEAPGKCQPIANLRTARNSRGSDGAASTDQRCRLNNATKRASANAVSTLGSPRRGAL